MSGLSKVFEISLTSYRLDWANLPQGIGAAFTIPPAQAHIAIYFTDPKKKVVALSYWGASGSLGFMYVYHKGG